MVEPEFCPGAATAVVDDAKLAYLLNPDPRISRGKGKQFARLGFTASNWDALREAKLIAAGCFL